MRVRLGKFSMGIGDRFGRQGIAQLSAFVTAREKHGIEVTPVWNKSFREHSMIGTVPADVRKEADDAVAATGWAHAYFVDADHINLKTVEQFIESSDFFTLDVAEDIGVEPPAADVELFAEKHAGLCGAIKLPCRERPIIVGREDLLRVAKHYLSAVSHAKRIYEMIAVVKPAGSFVTEVSMDETETAQSPVDMLIILAAIADAGIPAATVAPKFSGRFNKGVDYVGDLEAFEDEFDADLAVIRYAVEKFGLPDDLKLSVHSGSDKFALYPVINSLLRIHDAGLHLKTAGTTWLEEIIGLALAGGDGLEIARDVYAAAYERVESLCEPYATVIDIDRKDLPSVEEVKTWTGQRLAETVRHDSRNASFNPNIRQLLHVGYKVAAEMGPRYLNVLGECEDSVAECVSGNILNRHIIPLFGGSCI